MITPTEKARMESLNQRNAADSNLAVNLDRTPKVVSVLWDFAVSGGANAADISLGYTFEEDCLVTRVFMKEITNVVGATSTYTLKGGSTAITDAIAVASMATGAMALASSATAVAIASGSALKLDIGTADASAGKVLFLIEILPARVN